MQQLTRDDAIKKSRAIHTPIGKRQIDDSVLTKAMGMENDRVIFPIDKIEFLKGDMLVLVTDGFYAARPSFENNMALLNQSKNFKSDFEDKIKKFQFFVDDDLTGIVLKRV